MTERETPPVPIFSPTHSDLLAQIQSLEGHLSRYARALRARDEYVRKLEDLLRSYGHDI